MAASALRADSTLSPTLAKNTTSPPPIILEKKTGQVIVWWTCYVLNSCRVNIFADIDSFPNALIMLTNIILVLVLTFGRSSSSQLLGLC